MVLESLAGLAIITILGLMLGMAMKSYVNDDHEKGDSK